jgi:hypothetical protein
MGGELKVSIHSDGWCQHGLTGSLRSGVRPDDSHVLDRWRLGDAHDGWHMPYQLLFPESQLDLAGPLDEQTRGIGASAAGRAIIVGVLVGGPDSSEATLAGDLGDAVVGRLERASGGSVVLVAFEKDFDDTQLREALKAMNGSSWSLPRSLSESTFGWATFGSDGDTRGVIEFSSNRSEVSKGGLPSIAFSGVQRPWEDLPEWVRERTDLCAVLVCKRGEGASLFVDTRARCLHIGLGEDVSALHADFEAGRVDEGWTEVAPDTFLTGILTQGSAERGGISASR